MGYTSLFEISPLSRSIPAFVHVFHEIVVEIATDIWCTCDRVFAFKIVKVRTAKRILVIYFITRTNFGYYTVCHVPPPCYVTGFNCGYVVRCLLIVDFFMQRIHQLICCNFSVIVLDVFRRFTSMVLIHVCTNNKIWISLLFF